MEKQETGQLGEQYAVDFLKQKGFQILDRNWRWRKAELDIVAMDGEILVFVEVKTRNNSVAKSAERSVHKKKRKLIISAANAYIEENSLENECRADVVIIFLNGAHPDINHYQNAFYPRP